jgi:hypothetical protein
MTAPHGVTLRRREGLGLVQRADRHIELSGDPLVGDLELSECVGAVRGTACAHRDPPTEHRLAVDRNRCHISSSTF